MDSEHHHERRFLVAVVLLAALAPAGYLAWSFRDVPHFGVYGDDAIYLVSAKSLARNGEYRILSLPGEPYQTKYPPLYPLLLSTAWWLGPAFPGNLPIAMLLNWSMLPIFVALAFVLFRGFGFAPLRSSILCVALGWNFVSLLLSVGLRSELMFCCLLLASLIVAERAAKDPAARWRAALCGVFAGTAYLARVAALPLLISVPSCFLLRRRRLHAVLFLAAALPFVAGWQLWLGRHPFSDPDPSMLFHTNYLEYYRRAMSWRELPAVFWNNLTTLGPEVQRLLTVGMHMDVLWGLDPLRLLAPLSIVGVLLLVRHDSALHYAAFGAIYVAQLLVWNYLPVDRFIFPLFPLLIGALSKLSERPFRRSQSLFRGPLSATSLVGSLGLALFGAAACVLVYCDGKGFLACFSTLERARTSSQELTVTFDWIKHSLPAGAAFYADRDASFYLHTGRHAASIQVPGNIVDPTAVEGLYAAIPEFAARHGLSHLLVTAMDFSHDPTPSVGREVVERLLRDGESVRELHRSGRTVVYQFIGVRREAGP